MLQQFQKVLLTPKPSQQMYLKKVQDAMLNTMQNMLPQNFDFGQLAKIFEKQSQYENLASLTYKLTQYFVKIITQNFISLQTYFGLQQQTQKLQSTIRGHIKMEQQMKMYLQHLQYKIQRYEYHLKKLRKKQVQNVQSSNQLKEYREKDNIQLLKKKQTQLLKQRLILLRKVDHLQRRLKDQQQQLRRLNSPTSATIQQIKEGLNIKQKQISENNQFLNPQQLNKITNENIDRRMSTYSLGSDNQITQKKSSIPMNGVQSYRLFSLTGKQQNQIGNFTSIQYMQTKKQITNKIPDSQMMQYSHQKQIGSKKKQQQNFCKTEILDFNQKFQDFRIHQNKQQMENKYLRDQTGQKQICNHQKEIIPDNSNQDVRFTNNQNVIYSDYSSNNFQKSKRAIQTLYFKNHNHINLTVHTINNQNRTSSENFIQENQNRIKKNDQKEEELNEMCSPIQRLTQIS